MCDEWPCGLVLLLAMWRQGGPRLAYLCGYAQVHACTPGLTWWLGGRLGHASQNGRAAPKKLVCVRACVRATHLHDRGVGTGESPRSCWHQLGREGPARKGRRRTHACSGGSQRGTSTPQAAVIIGAGSPKALTTMLGRAHVRSVQVGAHACMHALHVQHVGCACMQLYLPLKRLGASTHTRTARWQIPTATHPARAA